MIEKRILDVAMRQSAIDLNCDISDFSAEENRVVISETNHEARKYLTLPFDCDLVSYGGNIVASVKEELRETVADYLSRYEAAHCFETPNMHVLDDALSVHGLRICFMAEYFLPDETLTAAMQVPQEEAASVKDFPFTLRLLGPEDFAPLYIPEWRNALCEARKQLDVLGVGAFDGEKLVGLAGCSADCDTMWQIGVDVLPEYRKRGIASVITRRLALEILARGKVPFYCAAWSNIRSVRNAIKSSFRPAWVEMTAKPDAFVDKMNDIGQKC